jgi:hypothetical protein
MEEFSMREARHRKMTLQNEGHSIHGSKWIEQPKRSPMVNHCQRLVMLHKTPENSRFTQGPRSPKRPSRHSELFRLRIRDLLNKNPIIEREDGLPSRCVRRQNNFMPRSHEGVGQFGDGSLNAGALVKIVKVQKKLHVEDRAISTRIICSGRFRNRTRS